MENIITQIEEFLLKNAWGVIIAGIIASMLGTFICFIFRKTVEHFSKKYKIRKTKQRTITYALSFYRGAIAEYSKYSSYRQVLLVGDFLIESIFEGLKILIYIAITCLFVCISDGLLLHMTLIAICSFMISPHFSNLKELKQSYKLTFDHIFGKGFTERCIDGAMETLKKAQDDNKDNGNKTDSK